MIEKFDDIFRNEKNEHTALILTLSVLSEKLTDIANLISVTNKLSTDIKTLLQDAKKDTKPQIVWIDTLLPEDYME